MASSISPGHSDNEATLAGVEPEAQQNFRSYWCSGDAGYYERAILISPAADVSRAAGALNELLGAKPIHERVDAIDDALVTLEWVGLNIGFDGSRWIVIFRETWSVRLQWLIQECIRASVVVRQPRVFRDGVYLFAVTTSSNRRSD